MKRNQCGDLYIRQILGPYSRTSYDISQVSDWSRWPSRPIRSLRYIVTCTRIRLLMNKDGSCLLADQITAIWKSKVCLNINICNFCSEIKNMSYLFSPNWSCVSRYSGWKFKQDSLEGKQLIFYKKIQGLSWTEIIAIKEMFIILL